jgi:hypothetical protein
MTAADGLIITFERKRSLLVDFDKVMTAFDVVLKKELPKMNI